MLITVKMKFGTFMDLEDVICLFKRVCVNRAGALQQFFLKN